MKTLSFRNCLFRIFDTEADALAFSHDEAVKMGLGKEGDICQYWYDHRQTANGKWAVQCPEGTETEPDWAVAQ